MTTLLTILHVIVCLFLMLTVLLQSGKGGGLAGAFGGGGSTIFGGRGAGTILTRATMVLGAMFFLTCISLALLSTGGTTNQGRSLVQDEARRTSGTQPAGNTAPQSAPGAPSKAPAALPSAPAPGAAQGGAAGTPGAAKPAPAPATSGQPAPAGGKH
jgi:preprotein translocase subunit SecG